MQPFFWRGKAENITYCECVFVALVIQHANACAMLECRLWPVRLYDISSHRLTNDTIFGKTFVNTKCVF